MYLKNEIMHTKMQGKVFNIQRYTIHDGPGIRTEIFLKGCPLSCRWCGNPEGISSKIQMGFYASKCIGVQKCGLCEGRRDREDICPADAIKQWGKIMTIEEVMEVIRRDKNYYSKSGGGITISGGEPLLQAEFVAEIFRKCRELGIHTCLESTLSLDWPIIESVMEYTDMVITDIKHMNSIIHSEYTGVGNEKILENLKKLSQLVEWPDNEMSERKPIIIRVPVIPNVNDDMDNMAATAEFILNELNNNVYQLQLLSFMRLGEEKYKSLGMEYPMANVELDRKVFSEKINDFAKYFNGRGINCLVGTKEK